MTVEIDLNQCTLTELLDLISGGSNTGQIITILRKVIVGGRATTDKITGAQIGAVIQQLSESIKAEMNPKEAA